MLNIENKKPINYWGALRIAISAVIISTCLYISFKPIKSQEKPYRDFALTSLTASKTSETISGTEVITNFLVLNINSLGINSKPEGLKINVSGVITNSNGNTVKLMRYWVNGAVSIGVEASENTAMNCIGGSDTPTTTGKSLDTTFMFGSSEINRLTDEFKKSGKANVLINFCGIQLNQYNLDAELLVIEDQDPNNDRIDSNGNIVRTNILFLPLIRS